MSRDVTTQKAAPAAPPSKHQLAVMIWLAVFPTLTLLNLTLGDWLKQQSTVARTFILATIAVPIVIYGLMPHLHRLRATLIVRLAGWRGSPPAREGVYAEEVTESA
jgi:antibiotic biosynthesis monooxygenase (ABM) superfamily enzyme